MINRVKTVSTTLALLAAGACAAEPATTQPDEVRQALGPGGAAGEAIAAAQKMWEWMSKLRDMNEPSLSMEDLFAMRNDIAILKDGIAKLREESALLHKRVDALGTETRERSVADAYANVITALDIAAERPDLAFDASTWALNAANTLAAPNYYLFPYVPGTDRFDPRFSTPTFIMAVTTWLAIRGGGGIDMTDVSDAKLRAFTDRLDWVASTTWSSVSCAAQQEEVEIPCGRPDSGCRRIECQNYTECRDDILSEWSYYDIQRRPGGCAGFSVPAPEKARWLAELRYGPSAYDRLAASWRTFADMPNINFAVGRPAFQSPDPGWAPAERAVDGNTNGAWQADSVTHTDLAAGPWWWVDLGSVRHIQGIRLFNRTDCCSSRLSHYQVFVSADSTDGFDGSWPLIVDRSDLVIPDGDGSPHLLEVDVSARWVAITKTDTDILSLAEVQVLGQ
jgi:hypothetical protein